ncbi:hypothetical protein [Desulfovibrio sp. ZJ200]|uniref:hypothetical protein n=1 Tax=Desulfovibrio sp. ZJ200 TaxID=2709792 RepID=UPI0013EA6B18|nr:hypothetical protein [Desulfovibrio sp. ZJ200]
MSLKITLFRRLSRLRGNDGGEVIENEYFQSKNALEHFLFENALLTRKRQPPQRGVHSGENRVFA